METKALIRIKNISQKPAILLSYGWPLMAFVINWSLIIILCQGLGESYGISMFKFLFIALLASIVTTGIPTVWLKFNEDNVLTFKEIVTLLFMVTLVLGLQIILLTLVIDAPDNVLPEGSTVNVMFVLNITNIVSGIAVDVIMGLSGMTMIEEYLNADKLVKGKSKPITTIPNTTPSSTTPSNNPVTPSTTPAITLPTTTNPDPKI